MKYLEVVAAIIIHNNKILCVQRSESKLPYISKKWEFPGGKIESGESKEQTIKREIAEELELEIDLQEEFITITHQYPDFHLTMHSFICTCEEPELNLTEHIDHKWLNYDELFQLDWAPADIPIMTKLMQQS